MSTQTNSRNYCYTASPYSTIELQRVCYFWRIPNNLSCSTRRAMQLLLLMCLNWCWRGRYQVIYQIGVFISRSSVNLLPIPQVYIFPVFQVHYLFSLISSVLNLWKIVYKKKVSYLCHIFVTCKFFRTDSGVPQSEGRRPVGRPYTS